MSLKPLLFPVFVWERLSWFGEWIDGTTAHPGHGTLVGAITFAVVGAVAAIAFIKRLELAPVTVWAKSHPIVVILLATPVVAFVLLCLTKYLTFASATATTIGVLVALANNNRTHAKEEKRLERQGNAARAALSLELSAICEYCKEISAKFHTIEFDNPYMKAKEAVSKIQFPPAPLTVVATLKEVITSTIHEHIADRCALLLGHLQLLKANIRHLQTEDTYISQKDIYHEAVRVSFVYAIAETLFDFSRHGDLTIGSITWNRISGCVSLLEFDTTLEFSEYFNDCRETHIGNPLEMFTFRTSKDDYEDDEAA